MPAKRNATVAMMPMSAGVESDVPACADMRSVGVGVAVAGTVDVGGKVRARAVGEGGMDGMGGCGAGRWGNGELWGGDDNPRDAVVAVAVGNMAVGV